MIQGTCHLGEGDCSKAGKLTCGWCVKHYQRVRKTGDPQSTKRIKGDDEARFWSKTDRRGDGECWPWTGGIDAFGYGIFSHDGLMRKPHVWAYAHFVGPMPEGTTDLDHVCHTRVPECHGVCAHRRCVNFLQVPGFHLEAVSDEENRRRAHLGVSRDDVIGLHARWEAGEYIGILAAEAGISDSALHKRFRELDDEPRDGRRASRLQKMTDEEAIALHVRFLAGEGITALARETGCDRTSIYARFKRMQAAGELPEAS
jgi:hypothetical protein